MRIWSYLNVKMRNVSLKYFFCDGVMFSADYDVWHKHHNTNITSGEYDTNIIITWVHNTITEKNHDV